MARPERFELPTSWFVARRSIQLSYGRKAKIEISDAQVAARLVTPWASGARILTHQTRLPIREPSLRNIWRFVLKRGANGGLPERQRTAKPAGSAGPNRQEVYLLDNQTLATPHDEGPGLPDPISKLHIDTVFGYLCRDMPPL